MEYAYALDFPRLCDSYLFLFISIGGNIAIENSIPKISEIRNLLKHGRPRTSPYSVASAADQRIIQQKQGVPNNCLSMNLARYVTWQRRRSSVNGLTGFWRERSD